MCRDIARHHTWLYFCALEARRHRVWFNVGFGGRGWVLPGMCKLSLIQPMRKQRVSGTIKAFAYSDSSAWVLFDHLKIPPLDGWRWKSGQESWADASVNALRSCWFVRAQISPSQSVPSATPAGKGRAGIAAAFLQPCQGAVSVVIPAGERLALESSLVMVSISAAAAAFEAQNKGRQLDPPIARPSKGAGCTLFLCLRAVG